MIYCFMLSGNWTFMKDLVAASLIALNSISYEYQNGLKN